MVNTAYTVFQAWWFDPFVASVSFAVFIHLYWFYERKYGLSNVATLSEVDFIRGEYAVNQIACAYWVGIFVIKTSVKHLSLSTPDRPDGFPDGFPALFHLCAEIFSGLMVYDAIMFFFHWSLHECPFLRRFHAKHHKMRAGTVEARDTMIHSFLDVALQIACSIIAQQYTPWGSVKSRLARVFHNIFIVWMLVESHTSSPYPFIWRRFFAGVRNHRSHHLGQQHPSSSNGRDRYQQFFGYLDDARAWYLDSRAKVA